MYQSHVLFLDLYSTINDRLCHLHIHYLGYIYLFETNYLVKIIHFSIQRHYINKTSNYNILIMKWITKQAGIAVKHTENNSCTSQSELYHCNLSLTTVMPHFDTLLERRWKCISTRLLTITWSHYFIGPILLGCFPYHQSVYC